jgi:hypothetical protein
VDVVYPWIHEIQRLHPLGERLILRELVLLQDSALLSNAQPADFGAIKDLDEGRGFTVTYTPSVWDDYLEWQSTDKKIVIRTNHS